jgi:hypothetical protein
MAYEVEGISQAGSQVVAAPQREERVIDPYRSDASRLAQAVEKVGKIGQTNTTVDGKKDGGGPAESVAKAEETVTLSGGAAALARKEQKFRQQQADLSAKQKALDLEKAEIAEYKAMKEKLQAKDYSAVESLVDYTDYTNYLIEKGAGTSAEGEALKKLQADLESVKKAQQDDVSKRFDAVVAERRKAVVELVKTNTDFSSIKELKMEEAVVQHILDTWEHDSVELSPEQAAKEVEDLLVERAAKWSALSKVKPQGEPVEEKKQLPPLKNAVKTITNNMTAQNEIKRPAKSFQGMSDSERWAEARRRAEEKLKTKG